MGDQREGGCSCGALRYRLAAAPLFDDATDVTPDVHIFTRSKVGWVALPESTLAPAESLRRLQAVLPES